MTTAPATIYKMLTETLGEIDGLAELSRQIAQTVNRPWTYASAYEDIRTTDRYRVRPTAAGFHGFYTRAEADQIVQALNAAYAAGRDGFKAELRDLINAAEIER